MENGNDLISQQAATEMKLIDGGKLIADLRRYGHETISIDGLEGLIATQPEITDGQAIEHLQESGWMQNHDKQMYEMGLREQLADDSDSYDALLSSAQPERLTDDDFETIRIHLNAYKEKLGNQQRWKEAEEYQRIIDRFMAFASAQPERKWIPCSNPPKRHKDVIVRGIEAIGNVTVHKVMQWDVDTWRPTDYAPSVMWKEWSEI